MNAAQIPVFGGLFDDSSQNAIDQLLKNQQLYQDVQTPDIKYQEYDPTLADASLISDDTDTKTRQADYLNQLQDLSNTGTNAQNAAVFQKARDIASQGAGAAAGAALQDAQARGVRGSGLEFATREIGAQNAATRAQQAGLAQASNDATQRAAYTAAYGNALSGYRDQNNNLSAANSNILNQFNQANTQAVNAAKQQNIAQNQAVQQQNFNNTMTLAGAKAGANTTAALGYAAQNAANQSAQNNNTQMAGDIFGYYMGAPKKPTT
jgi:hypothetical protein